MTDETFEKAKEIKREISELKSFICNAKLCWSRLTFSEKLMKRKIIKHKGYGAFNDGEYKMPDELSQKVLEVMDKYLSELEEEYSKLN